jgi:hypothetical protein
MIGKSIWLSRVLVVMNAITSSQERASWHLSQRLMICCPHAALPVDTGHELNEIGGLAPQPQMLIDCIECGQDHSWTIEDAFLE